MPRIEGRPNPNTLVLTADLQILSAHAPAWDPSLQWRAFRCEVKDCEITTKSWDQYTLEYVIKHGWSDGLGDSWARVVPQRLWDSGRFKWICPQHHLELSKLHDEDDELNNPYFDPTDRDI